jgi:pyruvate dehydrogenase E2 component (dihydrolipoamide acetyltransferase)
MEIEIKLPSLGENVAGGDITNVLVKVGDQVEVEQDIVEIETDKAVIPVPSNKAGKVTKVHVSAGQNVAVGAALISVEAESGAAAPAEKPAAPAPKAEAPKAEAPKPAPAPAPEKPAEKPAPAKASAPEPAKPAPASNGGHKSTAVAAQASNGHEGVAAPAGPATRRLARELGVDISHVSGSGPGGRITREDIMAAVRQVARGIGGGSSAQTAVSPSSSGDQDNWGPVRREALTKIRKTIANKMVESATKIPHVTNYDDADITELERIRKNGLADYAGSQIKLTMMPFVMKAVAHALKHHPVINSVLDMDAGQLIYKQYINLGVAVDTERGLVVPVMRNVDRMSIPQIAQGLATTTQKARNTEYTIDDLRGGTFTISNMGAIGGTYSTPIINFPEVAILLVGRSRQLPVIVDGKIEPRLMMPLSLSYDHRVIDGGAAARFLNDVIGYLQAPGRLLLAP